MAASQAMAQVYPNELSFFGNWSRTRQSGQSVDVHNLDVGYGYYFTPQTVGTLSYSKLNTERTGSTSIMLGVKHYFDIGRRGSVIPYMNGGVGTTKGFGTTNNESDRGRRWEMGAGVATFFTEATSFDVGIEFFRNQTRPGASGTIYGMGFTTRF
jgi:opacity protein-like surface antigen